MTETIPPRAVTPFEARLLTVLRAFVRLGPIEPALPYLMDRQPAPAGLGTVCLEMICDNLSKGCVSYLAKQGGWRRERFLRDGKPVEGRLWQRSPVEELRLRFSAHAIDFLLWATARRAAGGKPWAPPFEELTLGDQLVVFLGYECMREAVTPNTWRTRPVFVRNPLCRLTYLGDFAGQTADAPDFSAWVIPPGSTILEALQSQFAERWITVERNKRLCGDWTEMNDLATTQDLVVGGFLEAADQAGRHDLARFLLRAASEYCVPERMPEDVIGGLLGGAPRRLAERYEIQARAAVLPRVLEQLSQWERRARGVGYLDDGYAAAQLFKSDWEAAGAPAALAVAQRLLRELQPVSPLAPEAPS